MGHNGSGFVAGISAGFVARTPTALEIVDLSSVWVPPPDDGPTEAEILEKLKALERHLLTTGWSMFVGAKRLRAGDAVLFIR
ncbi:hypothetical protein OROHE_021429 [Orobanche hederae]